MASSHRPKSLHFISPAGAGLVLICFFLPWLRVSCAGKDMILCGADMGGWLWLMFGSSALIIPAFLLLRARPQFLKWIFLACSLAAIAILTYKTAGVMLDPNIPFYVPEKFVGFRLKIGAAGTILGLILALCGAILLQWGFPARRSKGRRSTPEAVEN